MPLFTNTLWLHFGIVSFTAIMITFLHSLAIVFANTCAQSLGPSAIQLSVLASHVLQTEWKWLPQILPFSTVLSMLLFNFPLCKLSYKTQNCDEHANIRMWWIGYTGILKKQNKTGEMVQFLRNVGNLQNTQHTIRQCRCYQKCAREHVL